MKISASEHIYQTLTSDVGIAKAVGRKIFPLATKSEVRFPFIVYEKENVAPIYDKLSTLGVNLDYSIYVLSDTYTEAEQIAEMVVNSLNRKKARYDGYEVVNAVVSDVPEDFVNQTFVQQVRIRFTIK